MFFQCKGYSLAFRWQSTRRLPKKRDFPPRVARFLAPASSVFLNPYRFVLLTCAAFWLCVGSVLAQPACDTRARVLGHLSDKYSEAPISLGIASNGGLLELLTSRDGATWTIIITMPSGQTCLIAAGKDWLPVNGKQFVGEQS